MTKNINANRLSAIIIDDELHGRENLKKIIETYCPEIEVLSIADSAINGKKLVSEHNPDVVFLDINMPVLDGFDFLQEYDERNFMVVFVSAHEDYGINAVKAGAVDYLLKPVNIKELKQTIKKLIGLKNKKANEQIYFESDKILIPSSYGFNVLLIDDIIRMEAEGCYTKVYLKDKKKTIVSRTLKEFEDTIPKEKFYRVHKSHLINLKCVKEYSNIDGGFVTMNDGNKIEISRRKAPDFIQKIKTFIKTV